MKKIPILLFLMCNLLFSQKEPKVVSDAYNILLEDVKLIDTSKYFIEYHVNKDFFLNYTSDLDELEFEKSENCIKQDISKFIKNSRKNKTKKIKVQFLISPPYCDKSNNIIIFKTILFKVTDETIKGGVMQKIVLKIKNNRINTYEILTLKEY